MKHIFFINFLCFFMAAFYSVGFFRCQYFSVLTYCLYFGVEGEEFEGRCKKYMFCIDPVGNASLNVGCFTFQFIYFSIYADLVFFKAKL